MITFQKRVNESPISPDKREEIAILALQFLVADSERLERFLALTGLSPATIRAAAGQPEFFTAILDYLRSDEPLMLMFCHEAGLTPEQVAAC